MDLSENYKYIFVVLAYVGMIGELIYLPFRGKKLLSKAGEMKMVLKNKVKVVFILSYVCCFAIPLILLFRNFSTIINLMFVLVSILASELISRDASLTGKYGVYENCVIAGGKCVFYSDILTFPILEFPEEEQAKYDHASLVAATASEGTVNIVFSDVSECSSATKLIRELSGK